MTTVQMHSEMGREAHPAVNVKINAIRPDFEALLPLPLGSTKGPEDADFIEHFTDPGFTLEWIEEHVSESEREGWWQQACEDHFEQAAALAKETFGDHVEVYSEGRSGGWLVVYGLGDVEDWDEQQVTTWATFAEQVRKIADDVPYGYLWSLNANVYEPEQERVEAEAEVGGIYACRATGLTLDGLQAALEYVMLAGSGVAAPYPAGLVAEAPALLGIVKGWREPKDEEDDEN